MSLNFPSATDRISCPNDPFIKLFLTKLLFPFSNKTAVLILKRISSVVALLFALSAMAAKVDSNLRFVCNLRIKYP